MTAWTCVLAVVAIFAPLIFQCGRWTSRWNP